MVGRRLGAGRGASRGLVRGRLAVVVVLASLFGGLGVWSSAAWAGPGDLDTSFGQGGLAVADFGMVAGVNNNARGYALVVQPDGKVIVVGTALDQFGHTLDIVTARFTTAGALDPAWGNGGKGDFDFGGNEDGYGAVLQPDGKLLIGGDTTSLAGAGDMLVGRVNPDGTLDTTFGTMGWANPDFGGNEFGRAIALQPDGKILLAGNSESTSASALIVARLTNPQGAKDPGFGGLLGDAYVPLINVSTTVAAVAAEAGGTIDATGTASASGATGHGLFVAAFGSDGSAIYNDNEALGTDAAGTAIAVAPNGKRVVAGFTNVHGTYDFVVEQRSASDFSLDPMFGDGGHEIVDFGGTDDEANAMVVQPDGKIIVAGTTTAGSGATATVKIAVVRLQPNGQPDSTFGTNGTEVIGVAGAKLRANAVGLEANGDIIVGGAITPAGSTRTQLLAIRLHGDATGTATTGSGGTSSNGGSGSSSSGSSQTTTVTTPTGNQTLTLQTSASATCLAASAKLHATLNSTAIAGSTATALRFFKAQFSIDRGVKHVHHHTVHRQGKKVTVTTVTFTPNRTAHALPASPSFPLTGLKSGTHTLRIQALFHKTVQKRTQTVTKKLTQKFTVCAP
jgi:uncharacterized delta-60 repeat protein